MGLHAYPTNRNKKHLVLGRKLGFSHYRDLDMGAFTNWRRIQPGNPKKFNPEKQPPFNWYGDDDIRYLVKELGYSYLAVLALTRRNGQRITKDHARITQHLSLYSLHGEIMSGIWYGIIQWIRS